MYFYSFSIILKKKIEGDAKKVIQSAVDESCHQLKNKGAVYVATVLADGRKLRCCCAIADISVNARIVADLLIKNLETDCLAERFTEIDYDYYTSLRKKAVDGDLVSGEDELDKNIGSRFIYELENFDSTEEIVRAVASRTCALKKASALSHIEGLTDEVRRIFHMKSHPEFGHPVHYVILADEIGERTQARELLIGSLLARGRLCSGRVFSIPMAAFGGRSQSMMFRMIGMMKYCTVVITLECKTRESTFVEKDCLMLDAIGRMIKENGKDILFILELERKEMASLKQFKPFVQDVRFMTLAEKALNRSEAAAYISSLAKKDSIPNPERVGKMMIESTYYATEIRAKYSKWLDDYICSDIYPEYADLKLCEEKRADELQGNAYQKLERMVGLDEVKSIITEAVDFARAEKLYNASGVIIQSMTRHMVFTGNPGTAKTTCARLYAQIMKDNGLLKSGHLVEVGRQDIVSKYVGGTAPLVKEFFEKAEDGVLFIDEAYSLVERHEGLYGDEAINTIVQEMENHRKDVVVILAGYPEEMERLLSRNPGLRSRISYHVHFRDYTPEELLAIMNIFVRDSCMSLDVEAEEKLMRIFEYSAEMPDFGNGRFARNLFEKARMKQASRLVRLGLESEAEVRNLIADDFPEPEIREEKQIGFV